MFALRQHSLPESANGHLSDSPVGWASVRREFSAGGVLVRKIRGEYVVAAIRPAGRKPGLWALPKGNIAPGEDPAAAAVREVAEETGARGSLERKLGDVRYT